MDLAIVGVPLSIVHALAMSVWIGGVVLLARVVLAGPGEEDLVHAVRGFARLSNLAIGATIVTGIVQMILLDGGDLFGTSHGRVLLLKTVAVAGWHAQLEPDAPLVYSDPFEKTEMLVALEDFEAFAGWRPLDEAIAVLSAIDGTEDAVAALLADDPRAAIPLLLAVATPEAVAALGAAAEAAGLPAEEVAAYRTVAEQYPTDAGALLTPLLAYLRLDAGAAVYVPAGVPHSYIRGTGLEVMTSSDNVVRLGLTGKPVFVDHAVAALDLDVRPQVMPTRHGDLIWPVNAPFVVRMVSSGVERIPSGAYRILLAIEGTARVVSEFAEVTLRPGTAAVISADEPDHRVEADGLLAIVQSTER